MNIIRSLLVFELKRRLQKREILIVTAVLLVFLFFVNQGKNKFGAAIDNTKVFQQTEDRLVKSYINYTQYCSIGIRLLFIPSPFSILHNNPLYEGLLSTVNTGKKLTLDKTLKGKQFFVEKSPFNDFSGLILLCAAVFSVLYGYVTPGQKAYLRFLSGCLRTPGKSGMGKLFFALVVTRLLLLKLVFLLLFGVSLLWLGVHHINLLQTPIIFFILLIFIIVIFFFFAGFLFGTLKKRTVKLILLGVFYALSFILLPVVFNIYTDIDVSDMESLFEFESRNMELVMDVEKRLYAKFGSYKSGDVVPPELKVKIKEALDKEYKELFSREEQLMDKILAKVRNRHTLSCFYPVLFYNTSVGELSSCGELSVIDFFRNSLKVKKAFLNFYVEKKFMEASRPGHVESFVKGDENLFYSGSHMPFLFWAGTAVSLLYIVILAIASYYGLKRLLESAPEKGSTSKETIDIKLVGGQDYHIDTLDYAAVDHFYWVFSGNVKNFSGKISIDEKGIVTGEKQDFVYLCSIDDIPGEVKVNDILRLFRGMLKVSKDQMEAIKSGIGEGIGETRYLELAPDDKLKLLFKMALLVGSRFRVGPVYMFHNFISRISPGYLKEFAEEIKRLKSGDSVILYFSDTPLWKPLDVDHHNVYTRVGNIYEWHEARGLI